MCIRDSVYACRIFVPGMSEIYPVEELQWENNTVGNLVRPFSIKLQDLTKNESAELLETLLDLDLADELPVTTPVSYTHLRLLSLFRDKPLAPLQCPHQYRRRLLFDF